MHSISSSNFFCCPGALLPHFILREQDILFISRTHPWRIFWKEAIFSQMRPKSSFDLSTLRNRFQPLLLLKFHQAVNFFINFLSLPWCTSTPFYSERARYSVHLKNSSKGDILKRSNFFTDETKKVVLTCLRLETRSDNYYYWSFTMHSISSSNFFLRPWCTSTPIFTKRAR